MATLLNPLIISLIFLPSTLSQYNTYMLDVYGSIQKTYSFQNPDPLNTSLESTSCSSFPIHSRASLSYSKNYTSLVISRLVRDSSRVATIAFSLARVGLYSRLNYSSLSAPVTSGQSQGSGEYFVRIGIGSPVKMYYWIMDTGSDVNWLQCQPCVSCYPQSDPVYDPSQSSTYKPLSCDSAQCHALDESACFQDTCQYEISYGDGSFTIGELALDTLSFGLSGSVSDIALGCGHDNKGLFVAAAGLIGLGGGSLSLPSQLQAKSFSYCLVDGQSTSSSTLDFDSGKIYGSITTKLLHNYRIRTYRYIDLIGMSVGGRQLPISPSIFALDPSGNGGTILDSGTTVTRLPREAYNALRDEFVRQAMNLKRTGGYELFDTCYDLSESFDSEVAIPTISFDFREKQSLTIPPEGVLYQVDSNGKFCLAFASTSLKLSIIGNLQQQTTRINYDLANSIVEFEPKSC